MTTSTLPSSLARELRGVVMRDGVPWVPIFCANCGCDGGHVPEASVADGTGFAFYLCVPCAEKWSPLADTLVIPDDVFRQEVMALQQEQFGRQLDTPELIIQLDDPGSSLSKLARSRAAIVTQAKKG